MTDRVFSDRIIKAQRDVADARAQLIDTARELQARLAPRTLARDAWESAKVRGADLAEEAVDAVKKRPLAVSGAIAALTLFLAREPIKDGVSHFYDAMNRKKKPKAARNAKPAPAVQEDKPKAEKAPARPRRKAAQKVEKAS